MTTYRTGNPIGSTDPKDLYDNAENTDVFVNSLELEYWDDRFGRNRKTIYGMEQDFQQFLIDSGYVNIGDYTAGLEITERNQIFWKDGELYRAGAALELPYTTTGDWEVEGSLFKAVGDQALRQELSNNLDADKGAALVGYQGSTVSDKLDILLSSKNILEYIPKTEHESIKSGTSVFDCTESINEALIDNRVLYFPSGRYMVRAGIVAHEGNVLHGDGQSSKIELFPDSVATGMSMLVNFGYDTMPNYSAAGNIVIRNMSWDDRGDLDTTSGAGSVNTLLFGHAKGIIVEHCHFPNHKFHCIDFVGCKDSIAVFNVCENGKGSAFQIDRAVAGTNYDVYPDDTACDNIVIAYNDIYSSCFDPDNPQGYTAGIHLHRGGHNSIKLFENNLYGPFQGIFSDPNTTLRNLSIYENRMDGSESDVHPGDHHFGIRLLSACSETSIYSNTIKNWNDGGIEITYTNGPPLEWSNGVLINNNHISGCGSSSIHLFNNVSPKLTGNHIELSINDTIGIFLDGVELCSCSDNTIIGSGIDGGCIGVLAHSRTVYLRSTSIHGNTITKTQTAVKVDSDVIPVSDVRVVNNTIRENGVPQLILPATEVTHFGNHNFTSPWTLLNRGTEKAIFHNFSIRPSQITVLVSPNPDGSGARAAVVNFDGSNSSGCFLTEIGTLSVIVRGGANGVIAGLTSSGAFSGGGDGYVQIKATA